MAFDINTIGDDIAQIKNDIVRTDKILIALEATTVILLLVVLAVVTNKK